eukprot:m.200359 g.200359  ORF g.200359 m.200359 type:complete len:109 (+) comp39590_c2_seq6:550-876(+)
MSFLIPSCIRLSVEFNSPITSLAISCTNHSDDSRNATCVKLNGHYCQTTPSMTNKTTSDKHTLDGLHPSGRYCQVFASNADAGGSGQSNVLLLKLPAATVGCKCVAFY